MLSAADLVMVRLARVLVVDRGRVLCVEHRGDPHRLGLPGGHVEPGETDAEAAARELYEETALCALELLPLGVVREPGRRTALFAAVAQGTLRASDEGSVRWARAAELETGAHGAFYRAVLRALPR